MNKSKEPRTMCIDPDYEGYFDDTDENLLASGFIRVIEKSAYDSLQVELFDCLEAHNKLVDKILEGKTTILTLSAALELAKRQHSQSQAQVAALRDSHEAFCEQAQAKTDVDFTLLREANERLTAERDKLVDEIKILKKDIIVPTWCPDGP
jgi:hypothetical protein